MVKEATSKFDCVQFMRKARARIGAATEGVADEGRLAWCGSLSFRRHNSRICRAVEAGSLRTILRMRRCLRD